jgi:hypothetical protein
MGKTVFLTNGSGTTGYPYARKHTEDTNKIYSRHRAYPKLTLNGSQTNTYNAKL